MARPEHAGGQEIVVTHSSSSASHSVRSHLRLEIENYDDTIRKFIPGYEAGLKCAAEMVASIHPDLVLDLGAGTGALSEAVLNHQTVGSLQAIDLDLEMLEKARARLRKFASRVTFSVRSFLEPLPECDAVTASLALHHVPTLEAKRELYKRIFRALRPGGVMANADVTMSADNEERQATYERWADHLVACGIERARAFEHFAEWQEEDTYFPLEAELEIMREAGFRAECVWQEPPNCVLVGHKDASSGTP